MPINLVYFECHYTPPLGGATTTTSKSKFFSNISTSFPIARTSSPIISSNSSLFQVILLSLTSTTSLLAIGNNNINKCDDNNNSERDNDNALNKIIKSIKDSVEKGDYGTMLDANTMHLGTQVQVMIDLDMPSQLSYGFVCGFSSRFVLKKLDVVVLLYLVCNQID